MINVFQCLGKNIVTCVVCFYDMYQYEVNSIFWKFSKHKSCKIYLSSICYAYGPELFLLLAFYPFSMLSKFLLEQISLLFPPPFAIFMASLPFVQIYIKKRKKRKTEKLKKWKRPNFQNTFEITNLNGLGLFSRLV